MNNRSLITIKITDITAQLVIVCCTLDWQSLSLHNIFNIAGYTLGWQVLSFLFHLPLTQSWKLRGVRIAWGAYLGFFILLSVLLVCTIILFFIPVLLFPFIGPLFVAGYMVICVVECIRIMRIQEEEQELFSVVNNEL